MSLFLFCPQYLPKSFLQYAEKTLPARSLSTVVKAEIEEKRAADMRARATPQGSKFKYQDDANESEYDYVWWTERGTLFQLMVSQTMPLRPGLEYDVRRR